MEFVDEIHSMQMAHLRCFYLTTSARGMFMGGERVVKDEM